MNIKKVGKCFNRLRPPVRSRLRPRPHTYNTRFAQAAAQLATQEMHGHHDACHMYHLITGIRENFNQLKKGIRSDGTKEWAMKWEDWHRELVTEWRTVPTICSGFNVVRYLWAIKLPMWTPSALSSPQGWSLPCMANGWRQQVRLQQWFQRTCRIPHRFKTHFQ